MSRKSKWATKFHLMSFGVETAQVTMLIGTIQRICSHLEFLIKTIFHIDSFEVDRFEPGFVYCNDVGTLDRMC